MTPVFTYTIADWLKMRPGTNSRSLFSVRYLGLIRRSFFFELSLADFLMKTGVATLNPTVKKCVGEYVSMSVYLGVNQWSDGVTAESQLTKNKI